VTGFPWSWLWFINDKRNGASVDYTIHVPQRAHLADIRSVNGHIVIDGVSGDIAASTVNGETQIKDAARNLKLSTVNGRIAADMIVLGGGQSVSLDVVNGEIDLALPDDANASVSVSTVNGSITSEFPSLKVEKEFPVGNNLKGSLGDGGATVKITAVNGTIKILKNQAAKQTANTAAEDAGQTVAVGSRDNIDLPFVNDPQVIGEWESVDFVANPSDFRPDKPAWSGELSLRGLAFLEGGKTPQPWWTWTKGILIHHGDRTASHYEIREINGQQYLFLEWKSGDVTIRGMKPNYCVLRRRSLEGAAIP
jgi:bla regulator protein BlaR1